MQIEWGTDRVIQNVHWQHHLKASPSASDRCPPVLGALRGECIPIWLCFIPNPPLLLKKNYRFPVRFFERC